MISGIESGEIGELGEIGGLLPPTLLQPAPLTSRALAHAIDHHVAPLWRGEKNIDDDFFVWLTSLWSPSAAPERSSSVDRQRSWERPAGEISATAREAVSKA